MTCSSSSLLLLFVCLWISFSSYRVVSCGQVTLPSDRLWLWDLTHTHTLLSSQAFFSFFKSLQWDKQCSEPREFSACMRCFSSVRFLLWLDNQQHGLDVLLQLIVLSAGLTTFPLQVNPASVNPTCYELRPQLSTALRCNFFREKTLKGHAQDRFVVRRMLHATHAKC